LRLRIKFKKFLFTVVYKLDRVIMMKRITETFLAMKKSVVDISNRRSHVYLKYFF